MTLKKLVLAGLQLAVAMLSFSAAAPSAFAQAKWEKLAPFPEPAEEILGAAAGGKMYVFAGFIPVWKPKGLGLRIRSCHRSLDQEKAHGASFAPRCLHGISRQDLCVRRIRVSAVRPPGVGADQQRLGIRSGRRFLEGSGAHALKRGSPVATAVGDKIYVIGGVSLPPGSTDIAVSPTTPQISVGTVEEYDPESNTWRERSPMPTPRNHAAIGAVNGKIYVIGGRVGAAFIGLASDTSVVEEYDPGHRQMERHARSHAHGAQRPRIWRDQRTYLCSRRRIPGPAHDGHVPCRGSLRSGQQLPGPLCRPMPVSRHGLAAGAIGNQLDLGGRRRAIVWHWGRCLHQ